MRRRLLISVGVLAIVGIAAGDYLVNRTGAQDAPKKAEPEQKKDLFDVLKQSLEAKKDTSTPPALPLEPDLPLPPIQKGAPVVQTQALDVPKPSPVVPSPSVPAVPTPAPASQPVVPALTPPTPAVLVNPPSAPPPSAPSPSAPPPSVTPPSVTPPSVTPPSAPIAPVVPVKPNVDELRWPTSNMPADKAKIGPLPNSTPEPVTIKTKTSPWTLHVEVVDDLTIVTATVNKTHEFKIVCQSIDLQTGKDSLKAVGKVKITGDAMVGSCDRLAISLVEDRLLLEGAAEVQIQKTTVSSRPAAFELKGETLNLRIGDLQSEKFLQASWRRVPDEVASDRAINNRAITQPVSNGKEWSPYGKLSRTQAGYQLEGNGVTLQLQAPEGSPLEQYVGRTISVYGPTVGPSTVRVTHIALP